MAPDPAPDVREHNAMSDRVTWETCPRCGTLAALGWHSGTLVQVDCPRGCSVTAADVARTAPRRRTFQFPAPVAPRKAGVGGGRARPSPAPPSSWSATSAGRRTTPH